jgi:membrane-bound lytic murein transglycosylase F
MNYKYILILFSIISIISCSDKKQDRIVTPWGEDTLLSDTTSKSNNFSLNDIISNGEMIMLTLTGPESYYDYHGHGMGAQYLLCEKFAQKIGVSLRVEVCKDTAEMISRLEKGDGDIIAFPLKKSTKGDLRFCGAGIDSLNVQWAVQKDNKELADSLNKWYTPDMLSKIKKEESFLLSSRSIQRHIYSPMLSRAGGIISKFDKYFMMYSSIAGIDWRLMAAQCYQESCFDPNARSWAGACGLMQIVPSTASHLGISQSEVFNPEKNIEASARYFKELINKFGDIPNRMEKIYFVLACYNGGYNHIRDAMQLAKKHGRDSKRWGDVSEYVLNLTNPAYYNDPVVRYGYMRGTETVDYVNKIRQRWAEYKGVAHGGPFSSMGGAVPHRANKKYKYHI